MRVRLCLSKAQSWRSVRLLSDLSKGGKGVREETGEDQPYRGWGHVVLSLPCPIHFSRSLSLQPRTGERKIQKIHLNF